MPEIIDLDHVMITSAVWRAQHAHVARSLSSLAGLDPAQIPDEAGRIEMDGSLTIFVPLPNGREIAMTVPPGEWQRRQ